MRAAALALVLLVSAPAAIGATHRPATIWKAVTGFYGTRQVRFDRICQMRHLRERFALAQIRVHGRKRLAALHLVNARTGWIVMWADGEVSRRIGAATRSLVDSELTRLKATCLAP